MPDTQPHASALWRIDDVVVGHRFRSDLGDLTDLVASIKEFGILYPPLVSPDGVLLCGARRLAAMRQLGWDEVPVLVAVGVSGRLTALLAEQQENDVRLGLRPTEQAAMYAELKALYAADARRGRPPDGHGQGNADDSSAFPRGDSYSRIKAVEAVTGGRGHQRLEQINKIRGVAANEELPTSVRSLAASTLEEIDAGAATDPHYRKVQTAVQLATARPLVYGERASATDEEIAAMSREALEIAKEHRAAEIKARAAKRLAASSVRRSVRALVLSWRELDGWTRYYDVDQVARDLDDADWETVRRVLAESVAFLQRVANARAAASGERQVIEAV